MQLSSEWRAPLLALSTALSAWVLGACAPKIGDGCETSSDCSANGDRLCDPTEPGGYCTIFNCEPGSCPGESVCIAFQARPSLASACSDAQESSRFRRTFCVAKCSSNGDCRSGYECAELDDAKLAAQGQAPNPWGATVADDGRGSRACVVKFDARPVDEDAMAQVCTGADASFDDVVVWSSDAGASVDSGAAGAGGAGGAAAGGNGGTGAVSGAGGAGTSTGGNAGAGG